MGDLIQTTGLINAIKRHYPDAKTDLLVMSVFSPVTNHFDNINKVYSFDNEIFGDNIKSDLWTAYGELYKIITDLNNNNYDILLNPIVSKQSSLLAYLINAKQKAGMQYTANNEQKITSDFIAYHLANQHQLGDHCFNLVDIFAGLLNLRLEFSDYYIKANHGLADSVNLRKLDKFLQRNQSKDKKVIGIHIGASQSNKAWDVSLYRKLIKLLTDTRNMLVVLFGGYNELSYKSVFDDIENDNFINTLGDFNLDELITAINRIDLMLTNDTGPMHIATTLKKPIIDISLGPVSKWETGPYCQDAIIIEADIKCHPCNFEHKCTHWNCHYMIKPEIVYDVIMYKVSETDRKSEVYLSRMKEQTAVHFYLSKKDIFGFQFFLPFFRYQLSRDAYIFEIKRFIWALVLRGDNLNDKSYCLHLFSEYFAGVKESYTLKEYVFDDFIEYLSRVSKYTLNIIVYLEKIEYTKKNLDKIKEILQYVKSDKQKLFDIAKEYELIYDWFWFTTFKESEIEDEDIVMISKKTINVYKNLYTQCQLLSDLIKYKSTY